jgi:hypothetical protein
MGDSRRQKETTEYTVAMKGYTCTAARYIRVALKESSGRKVGEEEAMNSERSS